MVNVVIFLERRENGEISLPSGIFSNRQACRREAPLMLDERRFSAYLAREWAALPDALPARAVAGLLGYHRTTVNGWAEQRENAHGKLPSIHYFGETVFAKEQLIAFLASTANSGLAEKSAKHRALLEQYRKSENQR